MLTAKIQVLSTSYREYDQTCLVSFGPDYADGRNKEWATATPHLSLNMTVQAEIAKQLKVGKCYTLQFIDESEQA